MIPSSDKASPSAMVLVLRDDLRPERSSNCRLVNDEDDSAKAIEEEIERKLGRSDAYTKKCGQRQRGPRCKKDDNKGLEYFVSDNESNIFPS